MPIEFIGVSGYLGGIWVPIAMGVYGCLGIYRCLWVGLFGYGC